MNLIAKMLIDMAKFYSYELEQRQLEMYVEVLEQFPQDMVLNSGRDYVKDLKNSRFPIPPHTIIKNHLPQQASNEDLAKEAAARTLNAVSKFGWSNQGEAKAYIGELGWRAVSRFGGWMYICQNLGVTISPDTFYAQLRDLCRATLSLSSAGIDDQPIAITEGNKEGKVYSLVNTLAKKKELE